MKKGLMLALSMFVAFGFFVSCDKEDVERIVKAVGEELNIVGTTPPPNTMQQDEIEAINANAALDSSIYAITALLFSDKIITINESFTIQNDKNYIFFFELKNTDTGKVLYVPISSAADTWTFHSDNTNVVQYVKTGFTAKDTFYSNEDANITVNITWKGLTKEFKFVLKSNAEQI